MAATSSHGHVAGPRQMRKPRARGPGEVVVESFGTHAGGLSVWFVHTSPQPLTCLLMSTRAKPEPCDRTCVGAEWVLVTVVVFDAQ